MARIIISSIKRLTVNTLGFSIVNILITQKYKIIINYWKNNNPRVFIECILLGWNEVKYTHKRNN